MHYNFRFGLGMKTKTLSSHHFKPCDTGAPSTEYPIWQNKFRYRSIHPVCCSAGMLAWHAIHPLCCSAGMLAWHARTEKRIEHPCIIIHICIFSTRQGPSVSLKRITKSLLHSLITDRAAIRFDCVRWTKRDRVCPCACMRSIFDRFRRSDRRPSCRRSVRGTFLRVSNQNKARFYK
jgi:hypothetical protein